MVSEMSTFKTSVNIKFDIGKLSFVQRYLPTPSHADFLIGMSQSFIHKESKAAHISVGPYGSGKSLIATIMANIVSHAIEGEEAEQLVNKFQKVHQDVYDSLTPLLNLPRQYVPIVLNGNEGDFTEAILRKIRVILKKRNIEIETAGILRQVEDVLKIWKKDFPKTYEHFLERLTERNISLTDWLLQIEEQNTDEIKWFSDQYTQLTAGAYFEQNIQVHLVDQLTEVLKKLKEHNIGIFIIYDEFGRFLQTLSPHKVHKTMEDIQDLAEFVDRSDGYMHVLLISHQTMSQYMSGFQEDFRSEFQRVEKRYNTYFIDSDIATYYRMTDQYMSQLASQYPMQIPNFDGVQRKLRQYPLFNELNSQEIEKIVVEGAYPVHPVSLYLLPRVSKVFGQNERTLFTFLESDETGGLINHVIQEKGYYYANKIFDYFYRDLDMTTLDDLNQDIVRLYKRNLSKVSSAKRNQLQRDILKVITLWELTNSNAVHPIDVSLIAYSLGQLEDEVEQYLIEMAERKLIRYNRVLGHWELYEGSSTVLNTLIEEEQAKLKLTLEDRLDYVQEELPRKYYLARDYNDYRNITRFARVKVAASHQLLELQKEEILKLESRSQEDALVYLIVLTDEEEYSDVIRWMKERNNPYVFYVITRQPFKDIEGTINRELAIDTLLQNRTLLLEHNNLQEELQILKEELHHEFLAYIQHYYAFNRDSEWMHQGNRIQPTSALNFELILSEMMEERYSMTPIIMNDAVNRFIVKGVQRKSLYRVLDGIIQQPYTPMLGIEGQGPDYLVYATILKNHGVSLQDLDGLQTIEYAQMRKDLQQHLRQHPRSSLDTLSDILQSEPYGIRPPLIPLLTFMLLRDWLDQIMFYRHNMFVPALEAEKIYEMFKESAEYDYVFHDFDEHQLAFLQQVETIVSPYISEYVEDKTLLIQVSSGLLGWLRSLPRHTQMTERVSEDLQTLKRYIRQSEVNPLLAVESLFEKYGENIALLKQHMQQLEMTMIEFKESIESFICEQLKIASIDQMFEYPSSFTTEEIAHNNLLKVLSKSDEFIDFLNRYIGVEVEAWSDTTVDLFYRQFANDVQHAGNTSVEQGDYINLEYNGKYQRIKRVELSPKAEVIHKNVERMLRNAGRNVEVEELQYVLLQLLDDYTK